MDLNAINRDEETINYLPTKHYVAFFDILGFKEKVNQGEQESVPIIRNINKSIEVLRSNLQKQPITNFNAKYFSDCICISCPTYEANIGFLVHSLAEFQLFLTFNDIFIRGGLTVGSHFENKNIIFSKALIKAIELEKKAAYPRLLIDSSLMSIIKEDPLLSSGRISQFIYKAPDGMIFVDYLAAVGPLGKPIMEMDEIYKRHKNAIQKQIEENPYDSHILDKYRWLAGYHNIKLDRDYNSTNFKISKSDLIIDIAHANPKFQSVPKLYL
jgi:hypothetical protein